MAVTGWIYITKAGPVPGFSADLQRVIMFSLVLKALTD